MNGKLFGATALALAKDRTDFRSGVLRPRWASFGIVPAMPLVVCLFVLKGGVAAHAAGADAATLVKEMEAALAPERTAVRQMTFTVSPSGGVPTPITIGEVRGRVGNEERILAVVLAPASLRGTAYLIQHGTGDLNTQWVYLPVVGRVRKIMSHESYTPFLNSDFTYSDLRFVSSGPTLTLAGDAERDGVKCRLVQAIPKETWAYARTVTCIAVDSHLPVERQIFDGTNTLWKVQRWGRPTLIDGIPTIMTMSMEDVQAKTRSEVTVGAIHYGVTVPNELFDPANLGTAADAPILNGLLGASAPK